MVDNTLLLIAALLVGLLAALPITWYDKRHQHDDPLKPARPRRYWIGYYVFTALVNVALIYTILHIWYNYYFRSF